MRPDVAGTHSALIYRGSPEFVAAVGDFVREGLADGERVLVMAAPEKLQRLSACLGADAASVEFVDSRLTYQPQVASTRAVMELLRQSRGRPCRVAAEQALARRSPPEIEDYLRIEAAANIVYRPYPISVLCAYDASVLPADQLLGCEQTHPALLTGRHLAPSPRFTDPRRLVAGRATVVTPPASAASIGCDHATDLAAARAFVRSQAACAGLDQETAANLTQAVCEILTNALVHGKPPSRLHVYTEGPVLVCHVHDRGRAPIDPLAGYVPPPEVNDRGYGLWLARQLCDSAEIASDATGNHVRLLSLLPHATTPPGGGYRQPPAPAGE